MMRLKLSSGTIKELLYRCLPDLFYSSYNNVMTWNSDTDSLNKKAPTLFISFIPQ